MKLGGALTEVERDGSHLLCGGGARLPSAAGKTPTWGLSGLEFGINIPGTVGGAVRMNANAYGGQLAEVLEWVEVSTATGTERRTPDAFDFVYRNSNLDRGRRSSPAPPSRSPPATPRRSKRRSPRCADRRREAQPSGIKTFGSTFKNPDDQRAEGRSAGQLLEAAGCRGLEVGGARFSEKHANFVENMGQATTADVLALMAEGRRRVKEKFGVELEPEVQVLGDVEVPGSVGRGKKSRRKADGTVAARPIALPVALAVVAVAVYWFALRGSSTPDGRGAAGARRRPDRQRQARGPRQRRRQAPRFRHRGRRPTSRCCR